MTTLMLVPLTMLVSASAPQVSGDTVPLVVVRLAAEYVRSSMAQERGATVEGATWINFRDAAATIGRGTETPITVNMITRALGTARDYEGRHQPFQCGGDSREAPPACEVRDHGLSLAIDSVSVGGGQASVLLSAVVTSSSSETGLLFVRYRVSLSEDAPKGWQVTSADELARGPVRARAVPSSMNERAGP